MEKLNSSEWQLSMLEAALEESKKNMSEHSLSLQSLLEQAKRKLCLVENQNSQLQLQLQEAVNETSQSKEKVLTYETISRQLAEEASQAALAYQRAMKDLEEGNELEIYGGFNTHHHRNRTTSTISSFEDLFNDHHHVSSPSGNSCNSSFEVDLPTRMANSDDVVRDAKLLFEGWFEMATLNKRVSWPLSALKYTFFPMKYQWRYFLKMVVLIVFIVVVFSHIFAHIVSIMMSLCHMYTHVSFKK
jgi:hypothetical protein